MSLLEPGSLGLELLALAVSLVLIGGYHLYLRIRLARDPNYTVQAVNREARRRWVSHIMGSESRSVLGVQTLRNSTMAATFLASTAVLLIMGTLSLTGQADKLAATWHALNFGGVMHVGLWITKLLALVADFFVAFFAFSMAIRLFNHVGYQLGVPAQEDGRPAALRPEAVALHLNRAGQYYSVGMRAYYFAVPLVFWLFGPYFLIAASVVLILVLFRVDPMPSLD